MDKPNCLGFAVLDSSKLLIYENYYDNLQTYFNQKNQQLKYMDTDNLILTVNTKHTIKDLKNLEEFLDFSNLNKKY